MKKIYTLLLSLLLLGIGHANAQLSGDYIIKNDGSGDFTSLLFAVFALGTDGASGDVVFILEDGMVVDEGRIDFQAFAGSDNFSATIRPADNATNITFRNVDGANIFRFFTDANNYIFDGADPVSGNKVFNFEAIARNNEFMKIQRSSNIEVKNCNFLINDSGGISADTGARGYENILISGCDFIFSGSGTALFSNWEETDNFLFENNRLYNAPGVANLGSVSGVVSSGGVISVVNNVFNISADRFNGVFYALADATAEISFNTINLYGTEAGLQSTAADVVGIRKNGSSGSFTVPIQNNIINITRSYPSGWTKYGIYYGFSSIPAAEVNNNNINIVDDGQSDWYYVKNAFSNNIDDQVVATSLMPGTTFTTPIFRDQSQNDLSLTGTSLSDADLRGVPVTVTTDFLGTTRSDNAPSKGAFEIPNNIADIIGFTSANQSGVTIDNANNTVVSELVNGSSTTFSPTITLFPGTRSINPPGSTTRDFSTPQLYNVTAEDGTEESWQISAIVASSENDILSFSLPGQLSAAVIDEVEHTISASAPYNINTERIPTLTLSPSATSSPSSGEIVDFASPVVFTVTAQDGTEQTWTVTVKTPLAGTYAVKSGGDIANLADAVSAIKASGISDDVTLEIGEDQFLGTYLLDRYEGTDSHTLTIRPESGLQDINIAGFSLATIFQINGVENLIIDGMGVITFENQGNGAVFDTNLDFRGGNLHAKNIVIKNCDLIGARGGIRMAKVENITVEGNRLFGKPTTGTEGGFEGIGSSTDAAGEIIIRNNVIAIESGFGAINGFLVGINVFDVSATIQNNVISFSPSAAAIVRGMNVGITSDKSILLDHNTIVFGGVNSSTDAVIEGIRFHRGLDALVKTRNNIITMGSSISGGTKVGITSTSVISGAEIIGNNVDFNPSGTSQAYVKLASTEYDDTNFDDLSAITPGLTRATPSFTDIAVLDFSLNGEALLNPDFRNSPVAGVTTDLAGNTRSAVVPNKGALESVNNIADILTLTLPELIEPATVDRTNDVVTATVALDTDLSALSPTITLYPGATISPTSGIERDFTSAVNYTVTAENGVTQVWSVNIAEENFAPTDINISASSVNENAAEDIFIGNLTSQDVNAGDVHNYTLVAGLGDDDNDDFSVLDNQLLTATSFNFEAKDTYTIRVQSNDGNGGEFSKSFTIDINDVNEAPVGVTLTPTLPTAFDEGIVTNTVFAELSVVETDDGETVTFEFVAGAGATDNDKFEISGNDFITLNLLDFETQSDYSVRIKAADGSGLFTEEAIVFSIENVDESPTIINQTFEVAENSPATTIIGMIEASDPEGATLTFDPFSGETASVFGLLSDGTLSLNRSLDFEEEDPYLLEVTVRDPADQSATATITVEITDVNEDPSEVLLSNSAIGENLPVSTSIGTFSTEDVDADDTHSYTLVDEAGDPRDNANFEILGAELRSAVVFDFESKSSFEIYVRSTDAGGLSVEQRLTIEITDLEAQITAIELSNSSITEGLSVGTLVGELSAGGDDLSGNTTYTLVGGTGDTGNSAFTIAGDQLLSAESFDFGVQSSYDIRVQADNDGAGTFQQQLTITVSDDLKTDQTITFAPLDDKTFGDDAFTLSATATSNLPVAFMVANGPATLDGNKLTITGAGTVEIAANQEGNETFNAAPQVTQSFTVAMAAQTITLAEITDKDISESPVAITASTTSGLPLTIEVAGPATLSGTSLTLDDVGTVTVTVSQAGDDNYTAAVTQTTSFAVTEASLEEQTITFTALAGKTFGDDAFTLSATATSNLPVAFMVANGPATIDGNEVTITGAGEVTIAANQEGNETFNAAPQVTQSFTVSKADQTINITPIADKLTTDEPFNVIAGRSSNLPLSYAVSGPATIDGTTITLNGAVGTVTVTVSQDGDDNYNLASKTETFDVTAPILMNQTINFAALADKTFGDAPFTLSATTTSSLPVAFTVASGPATIDGNEVTITGAGAVTIAANQEGNETFNAAPQVSQSFTVAMAAQTINLAEITDKDISENLVDIVATIDSGLPLTIEVAGPATLSGTRLTLTDVGLVTVTVSQAGDADYNAAVTQTTSFTVTDLSRTNQTITFAEIATKTFGQAGFTLDATSSSSLDVTYTVVSGPISISGSTVTITGAGNATIAANQSGSATFNPAPEVPRTFAIAKANQTITFSNITDKTFGDDEFDITATTSAGLTVSFNVISGAASVSGNTVELTGAGTVELAADQSGNTNYNAASRMTRSFEVAKADQAITIEEITQKTTLSEPFDVVATVPTSLPLTYTVTGPATANSATITLTGTPGEVTVTASQAGDADYNIASATTTFTVVQGLLPQTITFAEVDDQIYGGTVALEATTDSNLPITYEAMTQNLQIDGATLTFTGVGFAAVKAIQAGSNEYQTAEEIQEFNIEKAPLTLKADDLSRSYAQANPELTVSANGLAYEETISEALTAQPEVVTPATEASIPSTYLISLTGGESANYTLTRENGELTVTKATLTVTAEDQTRQVGEATSQFTLTYAGFVNGQSETDLTTQPTATTTATNASSIGEYAINPQGGSSSIYNFDYVEGTLTIIGATLTGQVTPLTQGTATLWQQDGSNYVEMSQTTVNVDGSFTLDNIDAGNHTISIVPAQADQAAYFTTYYTSANLLSNATTFDLTQGTPDITISMVAKPTQGNGGQGSVSGVLGDDPTATGGRLLQASGLEDVDPIAGADIWLVDQSGTIVAHDVTDAQGRYAFTGLQTGSYTLQTNYNGLQLDFNNATVEVTDVDQTVGITTLINASGEVINVPGVVTALDELPQIEWAVYPNPAREYVQITIDQPGEWSLQLHNLSGQLMHQARFNQQASLQLGHLPKGIYLIQLSNPLNEQRLYRRIRLE